MEGSGGAGREPIMGVVGVPPVGSRAEPTVPRKLKGSIRLITNFLRFMLLLVTVLCH